MQIVRRSQSTLRGMAILDSAEVAYHLSLEIYAKRQPGSTRHIQIALNHTKNAIKFSVEAIEFVLSSGEGRDAHDGNVEDVEHFTDTFAFVRTLLRCLAKYQRRWTWLVSVVWNICSPHHTHTHSTLSCVSAVCAR